MLTPRFLLPVNNEPMVDLFATLSEKLVFSEKTLQPAIRRNRL